MNKFTTYLNFFFILFMLAGCEKEHTGFLFTEHAKFPIDNLKIIRYENYQKEIEQLEVQLSSYSGEIRDSLETLEILEKEEEIVLKECYRLDDIEKKLTAKYENYRAQFEEDSDMDPVRAAELLQSATKAHIEFETYEKDFLFPLQELIEINRNKITTLCQAEGLPVPFELTKELEQLKKQQSLDIPWTTSCIEQLLGTEPITYSLESLRSDQGEAAAADFAKYLTVIGGGRMYVDTKVNSPAGKYIVSLRVSNEGYSVVLDDIFTFILQ